MICCSKIYISTHLQALMFLLQMHQLLISWALIHPQTIRHTRFLTELWNCLHLVLGLKTMAFKNKTKQNTKKNPKVIKVRVKRFIFLWPQASLAYYFSTIQYGLNQFSKLDNALACTDLLPIKLNLFFSSTTHFASLSLPSSQHFWNILSDSSKRDNMIIKWQRVSAFVFCCICWIKN